MAKNNNQLLFPVTLAFLLVYVVGYDQNYNPYQINQGLNPYDNSNQPQKISEVRQTSNGWELYVFGQNFFLNGAGGQKYPRLLRNYGANSIR